MIRKSRGNTIRDNTIQDVPQTATERDLSAPPPMPTLPTRSEDLAQALHSIRSRVDQDRIDIGKTIEELHVMRSEIDATIAYLRAQYR